MPLLKIKRKGAEAPKMRSFYYLNNLFAFRICAIASLRLKFQLYKSREGNKKINSHEELL